MDRPLTRFYQGGDGPAAFRALERDTPFHDQWSELPMRDYLRALFALGKVLAENERPAEAVVHLRELLAQSPPDRFGAAPWLVAALIRLGLFVEAEQWVETYEEHAIGFPAELWTGLARFFIEVARGEDPEAALTALRSARGAGDASAPSVRLMSGRTPPTGGSHKFAAHEVAEVNVWRAFHPSLATAPQLRQALVHAIK